MAMASPHETAVVVRAKADPVMMVLPTVLSVVIVDGILAKNMLFWSGSVVRLCLIGQDARSKREDRRKMRT